MMYGKYRVTIAVFFLPAFFTGLQEIFILLASETIAFPIFRLCPINCSCEPAWRSRQMWWKRFPIAFDLLNPCSFSCRTKEGDFRI